jgi:hypothetical protein
MTTIEMPMGEPLPEGCACTWQYDDKRRVKSIKVFHANCDIPEHVKAYRRSQVEAPVLAEVIPAEKRGRGRPRNPAGQWHKEESA